jgi:hypothetical protein
MGDGNALGCSGRARGKDHPGIVGRLGEFDQVNRPRGAVRSRRDRQVVTEHSLDGCFGENRPGAIVWIFGVDRDVSSTGVQDAEDGDVQVGRTGPDPDADSVAAPDPGVGQPGCDLGCGFVELGVREHLDAVVERGRAGPGLDDLTEDIDQRPGRGCVVATEQGFRDESGHRAKCGRSR